MTKRILWLDNDPSYIKPFVECLRDLEYDVTVISSLLEAESQINIERYNMLILDVMIPTKNAIEEMIYKPEETDFGHRAGLFFFKRMGEKLIQKKTETLVLTVRLDKRIADEFVEAGLPRDRVATKSSLCEMPTFIKRVNSILGYLDVMAHG